MDALCSEIFSAVSRNSQYGLMIGVSVGMAVLVLVIVSVLHVVIHMSRNRMAKQRYINVHVYMRLLDLQRNQ